MRRRTFWASFAAALALGAASAGNAVANTPLILKVGGVAAAEGSPASGALDLTCARLVFAGTLTINGQPTDEAAFTEGGGTDTCEGVRVRGVVRRVKLTSKGHFVLVTHITWEELTSGTCVYVIGKLAGTFTIPGQTTAEVSGIGKLAARRSTPGCREQIVVTEAGAALYHDATQEPYFAET